MSVDIHDPAQARTSDAAAILARAAVAERRADTHLARAIEDFFLVDEDRLDDRTRAAVGALLRTAVRAIARDVSGHAAWQLGNGVAMPAPGLDGTVVLGRLLDAGVLRDRDVMDELLGQVRQDLIAENLLANRAPGTQPALLPRLAASGDGVIAAAARAYLVAENRRCSPDDRESELPLAVYRRLVWWSAAALRDRRLIDRAYQTPIDHALAAAADRCLHAHEEKDRLDDAALRLAAAIVPRAAELGDLLVEAVEEGRAALFIALLGRMLSIDFIEARALVLDPDGERLWLALRAHGLDRATIARIGLALSDADPRRDIDAFADMLDTITAIPAPAAHDAWTALSLPPEFRAAVRALDRGARR